MSDSVWMLSSPTPLDPIFGIRGPVEEASNSYLARMLRLTLLAPDIIESILDGTGPDGISLEKLYQAPAIWEEQSQVLAPEWRGVQTVPRIPHSERVQGLIGT